MDICVAGQAMFTEHLGGDKYQVSHANHSIFAGPDPGSLDRTVFEAVDAVIDQHLVGEALDYFTGQATGQKRPDNGAGKPLRFAPGVKQSQEKPPVQPEHYPGVGKGEQKRAEHIKVFFLETESLVTTPPVAQPAYQARIIAQTGPAHTGVFDKKNPVAAGGKPGVDGGCSVRRSPQRYS